MNKPTFTYNGYADLLTTLREAGYALTSFEGRKTAKEPNAIIRHDLDVSVCKATAIAEIEKELGVTSTYFVMLTSPLYNVMDAENVSALAGIRNEGHEIGLHFDASKCDNIGAVGFERAVLKELGIFRSIFGFEAKSVSWHIPQKELLGTRIDFLRQLGIANAYEPMYFKEYKYLSDSSMKWRENPYSFMDAPNYPLLQILTHPVWYGVNESDTYETIRAQMNRLREKAVSQLCSICPKVSTQGLVQSIF